MFDWRCEQSTDWWQDVFWSGKWIEQRLIQRVGRKPINRFGWESNDLAAIKQGRSLLGSSFEQCCL
jgi:hypothetical protein